MILVIEDIDASGNATGIFAEGPPTANAENQFTPHYFGFRGRATDDGITFAGSPSTISYTFRLFPGDLMWGHSQGDSAKGRHIEGTITLQRNPRIDQIADSSPSLLLPVQQPAVAGTSDAFDSVQAGGLFTEQDMQHVRAIAIKDSLSAMPRFKIDRPDKRLPAGLRKFVGVWASEIAFNNGRGRHAMLIITNVEAPARATGYAIWGSPSELGQQAPASARPVEGKLIGDRLTFKNGEDDVIATLGNDDDLSMVYTFKRGGRITKVTLKPVWRLIDAERSAKL